MNQFVYHVTIPIMGYIDFNENLLSELKSS